MINDKYIIKAIEIYVESYSHKPHLGKLPHDLNTNDQDKLQERLDACKENLKQAEKELKDAKDLSNTMQNNIDENNKEISKLEKEINELQKQNDNINETMSKVYEHFDDVAKQAETFYEKSFEGWETDLLKPPSDYDSTYSDALENVEKGMRNFKENILPKGYIGDDDIAEIKEIAENFNYLSSMQDMNYSNAMDEYITGCNFMEDELNHYIEQFDINGENNNTVELAKREDGMSDKWYMITERNENNIESKNQTINNLNEKNEVLDNRKKHNDNEISKLETKVNDYSNHQTKIEEKMDGLKKD